jgi:hypothetical protein
MDMRSQNPDDWKNGTANSQSVTFVDAPQIKTVDVRKFADLRN